jgi:hypothetical protein
MQYFNSIQTVYFLTYTTKPVLSLIEIANHCTNLKNIHKNVKK